MDPVCGREGALPALVPSCVSHVRRPPINLLDYSKVLLDYCIVILVNKQFTYHHVITQITHFVSNIFCFIMKIPPPLHTLWPWLGGGGGAHTPLNPSLIFGGHNAVVIHN